MPTPRFPTLTPSPRGTRRTIYVSDPSSVALRYHPDPTTEEDLRTLIDEMVDAGTDMFIQEAYTQGWTTYWRTERFEYDARPQHRRFLPMLDAGVQPLQVMLDQSHKRGMEFLAGLRVNDNHGHISVEQGVGSGSTFVADSARYQIGDTASLGTHLDFTHQEVRDYVASAAEHLLETFDVDGLELCFRDHGYFPEGTETERMPLMTEFVRAVYELVQAAGESRGRKLVLGVRVNATIDLCNDMGLDIETWVRERLIDYVSPSDTMYMAINDPIEQFAEIDTGTDCMFYPSIMPHSSARHIRLMNGQHLNLDQKRAAAQNFYAAGADGLSYYNHFLAMEWAPFYPMHLFEMDELSSPDKVARGPRHYKFEPMRAGQGIWEAGLSSRGRVDPERITLSRSKSSLSGKSRFRICEDLNNVRRASLLFRAYNMTALDEVVVHLNGQEITPPTLKFRDAPKPMTASAVNIADHENRIDMKGGADFSSHNTMGLSPVPAIPDSFMTGYFRLTSPPTTFGDNFLEVTLTSSDQSASDDIVIEEVEVHVMP